MEVYKATEPLKDDTTGKYFYPITVASQVDMGNGTKLDKFLENANGMELLWRNASPNSEFPPQTISVDLSKGELFLMKAKRWADLNQYLTVVFMKNETNYIYLAYPTDSYYKYDIHYRSFAVATNSITVYDNTTINAQSAPTVSNNALKPYEIYKLR